MRVVYVVCPTCRKRKVLRHDTEDTRTYTEKNMYAKCIECRRLPETPEEKLLRAMFGEQQP